MKICTKCKVEKEFNYFSKSKNRKDGLDCQCKQCQHEYRLANKEKIAESKKEYAIENKEKISEYKKQYNLNNRDDIAIKRNKYYMDNKDKLAEKQKEYVVKNKVKVAEYHAIYGKEYYINNKDKISAYYREHNIKHRESNSIKRKKYRQENPEVAKNSKAKRRSLEKDNGKLSKGILTQLYQIQKGLCICCKEPLGDDYHLDHIMPLALGGTNTDDNVQLLKAKCNLQKSAKHPVDFMQSKGFLL